MSFFLSLAIWRDVSLIWLSLLCLIGLAVPLALAYLAVRGMDAALKKAGQGMQKAQGYSKIAREQTERLCAQARTPAVRVHRKVAYWRRVVNALWPRPSDRSGKQGPNVGQTHTDTVARPVPHARSEPIARTTSNAR